MPENLLAPTRFDLTIKDVSKQNAEAIITAAAEILGGSVEISFVARNDNGHGNVPTVIPKKCGYRENHTHHRWTDNVDDYDCPGRLVYGDV